MSNAPTHSSTPSTAAIFGLAWPLMLKAMMVHGIVVIDAYLVSSLGEPALAAMGLAASFGGLLLGILFAFSTATQIRIAQSFGSGKPVALKTGFYAGLVINLVAAGIGAALIWGGSGILIDSFAHTTWIADQAKNYLNVFLMLVFIEAFGQCLGSYFNGCGKTITPFRSYLIAIPLNVAVSYVLIHGLYGFPELGVTGAAVGSAVASLARALFLGITFYRLNRAYIGLTGWLHGTFWASTRRHLTFSLPIAGTFISNAVANNVSMLLYAKMSVNQFAAMTLILPWVNVAGTFGMAWAQSTGIIVAQLLGSNRTGPELDAFLSRAWRMAFVAAALVSVTYLIVSLSSDRIYGNLEPETTAALLSFLPILLILPFPKGSNAICGQTLRASGDTLYVMNIFVSAQWLFKVPLTAIFILYLDLSVTWVFALVLFEELVKFPMFHLRIYKGTWKHSVFSD